MTRPLDETDVNLIAALRHQPRSTLVQLATAVGIARGTVYSRLERLEREGVITGYGPDVDAVQAGFAVRAFCLLEIVQGSLTETEAQLHAIPQVLEVHAITGSADVICNIVARSNDHLHGVLQRIAAIETVRQSETMLALSSHIRRSVADVLIAS